MFQTNPHSSATPPPASGLRPGANPYFALVLGLFALVALVFTSRDVSATRLPAGAPRTLRPNGAGGVAPNFQISSGVTEAVVNVTGSNYELGRHLGVAFSGGNLYPVWADNSPGLIGTTGGGLHLNMAAAAVNVTSGGTANVGTNVDISEMPLNQTEPAIAVNPTNPLNLVAVGTVDVLFNGIVHSVSMDGGATWAIDLLATGTDGLVPATGVFAPSTPAPSVAFDAFGNCFISYEGTPATFSNSIEVIQSSDGGVTFTPLATLDEGPQFATFPLVGLPMNYDTVDRSRIATGPDGAGNQSVWVVWEHFGENTADTMANSTVDAAGAQVLGLGQINNFETTEVLPGSANGNFSDIAVGASGQVVVTYESPSTSAGPASIYLQEDPDGLGPQGFGFSVLVSRTDVGGSAVIPANSPQGIDAEPRLAYDTSNGPNAGRLYLVYANAGSVNNVNTDIYLRSSDNDGGSWGAATKVNDDNTKFSHFAPDIAVDPATGNVGIVWYDCRNDPGNGSGDRDMIANDDVEVWGEVLSPSATANLEFSSVSYSANETDGTAAVIVNRIGNLGVATSVDYTTVDGTATAGPDYIAVSGSLQFKAGQTFQPITVNIIDNNLIEGTHSFSVKLSNPVGGVLGSISSASVNIADDTAKPAPTNLTGSVLNATQISLSWQNNAGNQDGFEIDRAIGSGSFSVLTEVAASSTTFVDNGLIPGAAYSYRVRATKLTNSSDYSNIVAITIGAIEFNSTTYTAPESGGIATVVLDRTGDASGTVTANLATADGTAQAGVDYVAFTGTVTFSPGVSSLNVPIQLLDNGALDGNTAFTVSVTAVSGSGVVLGSPLTTQVTIQGDTAKPAPTNLTATVETGSSILLNWVDHATNAAAYRIQRSVNGGAFALLATTGSSALSYLDTGLTPGTTYSYEVAATAGTFASNYSNIATATPTSIQFSAATYTTPENSGAVSLTVTRTGDLLETATVQYATADDTAISPTDYQSTSGTITFAPGESSASFSVPIVQTQLLEDNPQFTATLTNATGTGVVVGTQSTATVTILEVTSGLAPSNLSAAALSSSAIQLQWTNNCLNAQTIEIDRRSAGGTFQVLTVLQNASQTSYTDTGLPANTGFLYEVRCANSAGASTFSNQAGATTLLLTPGAPTGLTAVAIAPTEIELAWTDNSNDETEYDLVRTNGSQSVQFTLAANTSNYLDTSAVPGVTYTYQVFAANNSGQSAGSNSATVTIPLPPAPPTGLTATPVSPSQVLLSWNATGTGATQFEIQRESGSGGFATVAVVSATATTYQDSGLSTNVTYTYQVLESNVGGDSAPSNTDSVIISTQVHLEVTPTKLNFATTRSGSTATKTFQIKNAGQGTLGVQVGAPSAPNTPFTLVGGPAVFTLAAGKTRTITVQFNPAQPGSYADIIQVNSSDSAHDQVLVQLTGKGK